MTAVATRGATRRFGRFVAVDSVDMSVGPGEVVGLLGANGAGKTTLLRMILGLLSASDGEVTLFGGPPTRGRRRRTGYLPQTLGLWSDLTADENLAFSAGVFGVRPRPAPRGTGTTPVGELPLGMQRRVAFASALQHDPELLVLDEPTSGVAPLARARLWDEIRGQASQGVAVLVTTHYMDEARQADRLLLMARGRLVATGGEAEIVGDTMAVVVHTDHWDRAFAALDDAGIPAVLSGRDLRIPGAVAASVDDALKVAGVAGSVDEVPATLEEAMVLAAGTG